MPILHKSNQGYFSLTISPEMVKMFNLKSGMKYDWVNVNGFPTLVKSKEESE